MVASARPRATVGGKRKLDGRQKSAKTPNDDSDEDFESSGAEKRPRHIEKPRWACPFWKLDPMKHHTCFPRSQITPMHVKTHLLRKHVSGHMCETCSASFRTSIELYQHTCQNPGHSDHFSDISIDKLSQLQSMERQAAPSDYWYKMWDILFPALPRPESPLVEDPSQFHAGISSFIRTNPDIHNMTATQLMESLLKFGSGGLSSESFPHDTTTNRPGSSAPHRATFQTQRQVPLLHDLANTTVPPNDPEYGSRIDIAASTGCLPGYSIRDTTHDYDKLENDMTASYRDELTTILSISYVKELLDAMSSHLRRFLHPENVSYVRAELPEIITAFAIRMGHESDKTAHRDVMRFVRKHCLPIVNQVIAEVTSDSMRYQASTTCQPRQPTMNYEEKIDILWTLQDEKMQPQFQKTLFEGVADESENDTFNMEPDDYDEVRYLSKSFSWLISDLKRLCSLEGAYGDSYKSGGVIRNRHLILRSFRTGRISSSEPPQKQTAHFRLFEWTETFQAGQGFDTVITTCLSGNAQATSVKQYMAQTWPTTGLQIFSVLQKTINRGRTGNETRHILQDNTELVVNGNGAVLVLTVSGISQTIAEFGEQIAWLWSAVKSPRNTTPHSYTPIVAAAALASNSGSSGMVTTESQAVWFDIKFVRNPTESNTEGGLVWLNIFGRKATVLTAYPISRRPAGFPGLELSFSALLDLSRGRISIGGERQVSIEGGKICLRLRKHLDGLFLWHRLFPNGGACDDCGEQAGHYQVPINPLEFQHSSARHFVTSCGLETLNDFANGQAETILSSNADASNDALAVTNSSSKSSDGSILSVDTDTDSTSMSDSSDECFLFGNELLQHAANNVISKLVSGHRHLAGESNSSSSHNSNPDVLFASWGVANPSATVNQYQGGKHPRDDDDGFNGGPPQQPSSKVILLDSSTYFACPFLKRSPSKYAACIGLKMSRIRDVKQHLRRKHTPDAYCSRCITIFIDESSLNRHIPQCCPASPDLKIGWVTHSQSKKLQKQSKRGATTDEQWFAMWDVLFGIDTRPASVFLDSSAVEKVSKVREHLRVVGEPLLVQELQSAELWDQPETTHQSRQRLLQRIVTRAFDEICDQFIPTVESITSTSAETQLEPKNLSSKGTPSTSLVDSAVGIRNSTTTSLNLPVPDNSVYLAADSQEEQVQESSLEWFLLRCAPTPDDQGIQVADPAINVALLDETERCGNKDRNQIGSIIDDTDLAAFEFDIGDSVVPSSTSGPW